jgi:2,3-bisphosphoglycerate-independent phosphoglycerate mutase
MARPRPLVLCILDGFGERASSDANAVRLAKSPNLAALSAYPHTLIGTSGPDVGLPVGQMGNSEVGHLNFGAGRIAMMDISRIDVAIADKTLGKNPVLQRLFERAANEHKRLHLFGLVSDGGVHASMNHLEALIEHADFVGVKVVVHAFLDGRDTPPKSAAGYLEQLLGWLDDGKKGVIGTVSGRYWAMDRDKRWDRVNKAYSAIVRGQAEHRALDAMTALFDAYDRGENDEFVAPTIIGDYKGVELECQADFAGADKTKGEWSWRGVEYGLGFNFRPDRMRELSAMLSRRNMPVDIAEETLMMNHQTLTAFTGDTYVCMTEYESALKLPVAFTKEDVPDSFGEVVARAGLKQLRCAETEKYAHVTYFFSGGREAVFEGEDRKLVPSPRDVATYDKKPSMSAAGVTAEVVKAIESDKYDFILVNYANPDMVGHTGILDAAIEAVEAVDVGIGALRAAIAAKGGALLVTADHGNCEQMHDAQGGPHTAHTTNPVPLYYVNENDRDCALRSGGRICDVAPMMLEVMGLPQPALMTGRSLREKR